MNMMSWESIFKRTEASFLLRGRLRWLDALRGLTLCSMIFYHGMWDAVYLRGLAAPWYAALPGYLWQQSICWSFILLSGFSFRLGRRPLRRGLEVSIAGALVMAVTGLIMPEERILFGVLSLLGACMLLLIVPDRLISKCLKNRVCACRAGGAVLFFSLLCFFLSRDVNSGYLGFEGLRLFALPAPLYRNLFTAWLGFPPRGFYSTDYFSLLPWCFLYLAGYGLRLLWETRGEKREAAGQRRSAVTRDMPGVPLHFLEFLGRHSLWIYLLHQPLLMLGFQLVCA